MLTVIAKKQIALKFFKMQRDLIAWGFSYM